MDKITHQVRCERWTKIINECLASGMKKTAWCREHGISPKSFFYWQRILREEAYISSIETSLAPVNDANLQPQNKVDFVELRMPKQTNQDSDIFIPDIIIRKDSVSIEISNTASSELLSKIGGLLHA